MTYQDKINALKIKLLAIAGESFHAPAFEEDIERILEDGFQASTSGLYVMKGQDNQCHQNSACCWNANRKHSVIMTGYALHNGTWVSHSWVVDSKSNIVETTFPREIYFGFLLTDEEAQKFYDDNVW